MTITWHQDGLAHPYYTNWLPMDEPVSEYFREAGPDGWMEFSGVGPNGEQMWRMWKPSNLRGFGG